MITITIPNRKPGTIGVRVWDSREDEVPTAAHIILYTERQETLLLRRTGQDYGGHWGLPGGGIDAKETPLVALLRELVEEIGVDLKTTPGALLRIQEREVSQNSKVFALPCHRFIPQLNSGHDDYCWRAWDHLPQPMHPNARVAIRHFFNFY